MTNRLDAPRLAREVMKGDRVALAKAITTVENDRKAASALLGLLRPTGRTFVVGVTGPPGTGKSTLVDRLIMSYRKMGLRVAVVAVDPTSPLTGGALLGDRIRMTARAGDTGVFIRSMASRGWSGGLSRATAQVIQVIDAAGFDLLLLETVGIGQSDIEVVSVAHAVLVVLVPGLGDEIQVSKAGLMEVGDVYVVNKGDLAGADLLVMSLLSMVRSLRSRSPPVIKVSAVSGEGIDGLVKAIEALRDNFAEGGSGARLRSIRGMIIETAKGDMLERFGARGEARAEKLARSVLAGKISVDEAARRLVR